MSPQTPDFVILQRRFRARRRAAASLIIRQTRAAPTSLRKRCAPFHRLRTFQQPDPPTELTHRSAATHASLRCKILAPARMRQPVPSPKRTVFQTVPTSASGCVANNRENTSRRSDAPSVMSILTGLIRCRLVSSRRQRRPTLKPGVQ